MSNNTVEPVKVQLTMYVILVRGSVPAKLFQHGFATRKEAERLARGWNATNKAEGMPTRFDVRARHVWAPTPTY